MKRLIFSLTVTSLFSFVAVAQSPKPTSRPPATGPTSSTPGPTGGTGAEGKIAFLSFAQFREGINEFKVRIDALNTELEPKLKEIKAMEDELINLKDQLQTKGNTVSAQVRNQWIEEAAGKERLYKRKGEDFQQLGQKRWAEVSQPIYEKVFKFLDGYCTARGIVFVMEADAAYQAGVLFWVKPTADITDDFMKEYNKANPATGAVSPGAGSKKP